MTKPKTLEQLRAEKEEQRHSFYRNSTSWSVWRRSRQELCANLYAGSG